MVLFRNERNADTGKKNPNCVRETEAHKPHKSKRRVGQLRGDQSLIRGLEGEMVQFSTRVIFYPTLYSALSLVRKNAVQRGTSPPTGEGRTRKLTIGPSRSDVLGKSREVGSCFGFSMEGEKGFSRNVSQVNVKRKRRNSKIRPG